MTDGSSWSMTGGTFSTGVTAAQFDNSNKLATTAFVKQNGVSFSGIQNISASRNVVPSDIGTKLIFQGSYTLTVPTPLSLGIRPGDTFTVSCYGGNIGAVAFSGSTYAYQTASLSSPIPVLAGESLCLIAESATTWEVGPSTAGMANLGSFSSSLIGGSGYQKLPSGMILQWGSGATNSSGAFTTSLPITFPNGWFAGYSSSQQAGSFVTTVANLVTTTISVIGYSSSNGVPAVGLYVTWLALGR